MQRPLSVDPETNGFSSNAENLSGLNRGFSSLGLQTRIDLWGEKVFKEVNRLFVLGRPTFLTEKLLVRNQNIIVSETSSLFLRKDVFDEIKCLRC